MLVCAFLKKTFQQFYISDTKSYIICSACHIFISLINSAENKRHVLHLGSRIICSHFSMLKPHTQAHLSLRSRSHALNCIIPFSFFKEHFYHHILAETKTPFHSYLQQKCSTPTTARDQITRGLSQLQHLGSKEAI